MNSPRLIVITDLDGTLLDQDTYRCDASLPAILRLLALKIPLVLCSSKTRGEIEPLWRELGLRDPFISENGGAIYFVPGYFPSPLSGVKSRGGFQAVEFGTDIAALRRALREAAARTGVRVRSFGDMSAEEVSQLTGLSRDQAVLALAREHDEPFVIEAGDKDRLFDALRADGLAPACGGRFFHVTGGHDKGRAVRLLLDLYRRVEPASASVGLGNSANDLPLLREVDRPVLIRNPGPAYDEAVLMAMPRIERTEKCGPAGWNAAIEKILRETSLEHSDS